jgi:hypothetical protein
MPDKKRLMRSVVVFTHHVRNILIYLRLYNPRGPLPLFQFFNLYTVSTSWTGDQPVARQLPAYKTAQTQNKRTQTSMPQV